jgi:hypothetical protein
MTSESTSEFTPIYTTVDNVKVRLANKVQFQADPSTVADGELPDVLLAQLIVDAETTVEQKLRGRYKIPFQSIRTHDWAGLPDHSRRAIRRAVDMACLMEVLRTDFGRGTHINGEDYYETTEKNFDKYIDELMGRDSEAAGKQHDRFRFTPPLEDMMLARSNSKADDGFKGAIINTDMDTHDAVTYAEEQINNPAASYVARRLTNPAQGGST